MTWIFVAAILAFGLWATTDLIISFRKERRFWEEERQFRVKHFERKATQLEVAEWLRDEAETHEGPTRDELLRYATGIAKGYYREDPPWKT